MKIIYCCCHIDSMKSPVGEVNVYKYASRFPKSSVSFDSLRMSQDKAVSIENNRLLAGGDYDPSKTFPYIVGLAGKKVSGASFASEDTIHPALTGSAAPGHFLSRSEDSLTALPDAPASDSLTRRRLELPRSVQGQIKSSKSNSGRTMSSAHLDSGQAVVKSLIEKSINEIIADQTDSHFNANSATTNNLRGVAGRAKQKPSIPDPRITRTKMTVTELQKQKKDLEAYVSELVKKAETKQAELAAMKMEIRRLKEEKDEEFEKLTLENETLKRQLSNISQKSSPAINDETLSVINCKMLVDVATSPILPSRRGHDANGGSPTTSTTDTTGQCNDDDDEIDDDMVAKSIPPLMTSSSVEGTAIGRSINSINNKVDWDRQSTGSEMSLACLHDRIVQMEETHYSTNEELQATLQELTDLQDTVNDLVQENRQLFDDKTVLYDSLCKQAAKVDNYRLQIENLKHLLLSSTDLCFSRRFGQKRESVNGASYSANEEANEVELQQNDRLLEILKNTHEDYEDLLRKYENVRFSFKSVDDERIEYKKLAEQLSEQCESTERRCERLQIDNRAFEEKVISLNKKVIENQREAQRLSIFCDKERKKCEELRQLLAEKLGDSATDAQIAALKRITEQKDCLEDKVTRLEDALASKEAGDELNNSKVAELQKALDFQRSESGSLMYNESGVCRLQAENDSLRDQMFELKNVAMDLTQACERHMDDTKELQRELSILRDSCSALTMDNDRIGKELADHKAQRERELDEWRQFQADLQIAVVVANDFKVEAQEELERLATQNKELVDRVATLSSELEKLRCAELEAHRLNNTQRQSDDALSPLKQHRTFISPEVKTRVNGYLNNVESASALPNIHCGSRQRLMTSQNAGGKCVLSVRALVESLESASSAASRQRQHCLRSTSGGGAANRLIMPLRSPGAAGGKSPASTLLVGSAAAQNVNRDAPSLSAPSIVDGVVGCGLAKRGVVAGVRPISLESIDSPSTSSLGGITSPKQTIKTTSSECNALLNGVHVRGSPLKTSSLTSNLPPDVNLLPVSNTVKNSSTLSNVTAAKTEVEIASVAAPLTSSPTNKGILKNQKTKSQQQQRQPRKSSYLDLENRDPLAKLMKDAPRGSRRNALLRWCQNRTMGYKDVEITNFSSSWNDGLAFCALIHSFAPDKIPFDSLNVNDKTCNFTLAFKTAESLGIPATLTVDDMLCFERPNWQAVMTYVTSIYTRLEFA